MKAILFSSPSNVNWVHNFINELRLSFERLGVECMVLEGSRFTQKEGGSIIDRFRPDWTFSINQMFPQYLNKDGTMTTVYDAFQIPHYVYLVDNPFLWLTSKSINFDSRYLNVITIDNKDVLTDAGITRCEEILYGCPASLRKPHLQHPDCKAKRLLFAGSVGRASDEAEKIASLPGLTPEQKRATLNYCQSIYERISTEKKFLKQNLLTEFYQTNTKNGLFDSEVKYNTQMSESFACIERFYECLAREVILGQFKQTNIPCLMAGDEKMAELCQGAGSMQYIGSLIYDSYINMIAQTGVSLNITPKHLRVHDRITSALMSGSLLVTTPVPKLVKEYPELADIIIEAEFGSAEYLEKLNSVIADSGEYQRRIDAGAELAAKYFSWDSTAEKIISYVIKSSS
ncbi:MAG: glycosyltransferase [Deferribacterales bacterium]